MVAVKKTVLMSSYDAHEATSTICCKEIDKCPGEEHTKL